VRPLLLFLAVSRAVVRWNAERADEIAFVVGHRPANLGDAQAIKRFDAGGRLDARNFFPAQALITFRGSSLILVNFLCIYK